MLHWRYKKYFEIDALTLDVSYHCRHEKTRMRQILLGFICEKMNPLITYK